MSAAFSIDTDCDDISGFRSGYRVFDDYLRHRNDSAVIHYVTDSATDRLVAYFSLAAYGAMYGDPANMNIVPAIELSMFALDERYHGTGVSGILLDDAIEIIKLYAKKHVGPEIIILYAVPAQHVIDLYKSKGFKTVGGLLTAFRSEFTEGCVPMYMTIGEPPADG